jgi:LuxR family maltose regulon positive regulatory protein
MMDSTRFTQWGSWRGVVGSWGLLDILILKTMALQAQGDIAQALSILQQALTLAEPEGLVLVFVDEGTPMAQLLRLAADHGIATDYVDRLLAAFSDLRPASSAPPSKGEAKLIEPLTQRELQVLQLIADGLSNREIADKLVISLGTVKVHARNIYGKLQVSRRTEAVARARHLGLLQ